MKYSEINCKGCQKCNASHPDIFPEERYDYYGMSTGYYCNDCYDNNYPYRKDAYFDASFAGERMEDDY